MTWRLIDLETHDAFTNMALDEAALEAIASGDAPPTIRFYRWTPSAVSIGYFQSYEREVANDVCEKHGIDVVRRRTGGGAVYHDTNDEITYSVVGHEKLFPKDLTESYTVICGHVVEAMKMLGFDDASFHPINDVLIGGKKVSGNAQTRRGGVLLQHGTILYGVDVRKMFSVLKVGQEKIADKMIKAVEDRVTGIRHLKPHVTYDAVYEALKKSFLKGKDWAKGAWTAAELKRARKLAKERYRTEKWNKLK